MAGEKDKAIGNKMTKTLKSQLGKEELRDAILDSVGFGKKEGEVYLNGVPLWFLIEKLLSLYEQFCLGVIGKNEDDSMGGFNTTRNKLREEQKKKLKKEVK